MRECLRADLESRTAIPDQIEDQQCPRNNEQQMNELTADIADYAQEPQSKKNSYNRPKHISPPVAQAFTPASVSSALPI